MRPDDAERDQDRFDEELAAYEAEREARIRARAQKRTPQPTRVPILGVAIALVLLGGVATAAVIGVRALTNGSTQAPPDAAAPAAALAASEAYENAEAALVARLAQEGIGDWVYHVDEEGDGFVVFIVGPPASEWVSTYTVERGGTGWAVTKANSLVAEGTGDGTAQEAEQVVLAWLRAVSEDRSAEARAFTVDPFRGDPASAQIAEGGLTGFAVTSSIVESDGSFWVQTTQEWFGATENWEYWVVPTEAGLRIADVQPW